VPLGVLNIPDTFYALPSGLDALRVVIDLQRALGGGERLHDAEFERDLSRALGYSEEEIARYHFDSSGFATEITGPPRRS
jgi:hypothetical protein